MKSRFYVVGAPVEDLEGGLLRVKEKTFTQDELENLSFYNRNKIRVFKSQDQANEYAYGLRQNADHYSCFPKTPLNKSKVRPVFTIKLNETNLGQPHSKSFKYNEHYVEQCHKITRKKQVELNYYEIDSKLVNKSDIIRADFYNSKVEPVEFVHTNYSNYSCEEIFFIGASLGMYAYLRNCIGLDEKITTPTAILKIGLAVLVPPVAMIIGIFSIFCMPSKETKPDNLVNPHQAINSI